MRIVKIILLATCVVAFFGTSYSQNDSKVYITQTINKIYYSVYVNPVVLETLDTGSAKDYVAGDDYAVNDLVRIPVQIGSDKNAHVVYAKIIGQVPDDFIAGLNDKLIEESKKRFGEKNVEAWPEQYMEKQPWGIKYDEKTINCKYYILNTIAGFKPRIDYSELGEGTSIPASDGLISFEITGPQSTDNNNFKVVRISDFTVNNYTLVLKSKVKPGKKGKNVAKEVQNDLTKENKVVTKLVSKDIQTEAEERDASILEAWEKFFSPEIKDDLISNSDNYFKENVNSTIEDFFAEMDEKLEQ